MSKIFVLFHLWPFVNIHNKFEYRHMMLPKDLAKHVPKTHLMSGAEWRNLEVQQSLGMIFMIFIGQYSFTNIIGMDSEQFTVPEN